MCACIVLYLNTIALALINKKARNRGGSVISSNSAAVLFVFLQEIYVKTINTGIAGLDYLRRSIASGRQYISLTTKTNHSLWHNSLLAHQSRLQIRIKGARRCLARIIYMCHRLNCAQWEVGQIASAG